MIRNSKVLKRAISRIFNNERQADIWAFCALLTIGATDDLQAIVLQHPEKARLFYLTVIGCIYGAIKSRFKRAFRGVHVLAEALRGRFEHVSAGQACGHP